MNKSYLSTQEIIYKGIDLNKKHEAYKNARGEEKMNLWKDFYEAWQVYRKEVNAYVKTKPIDISDAL